MSELTALEKRQMLADELWDIAKEDKLLRRARSHRRGWSMERRGAVKRILIRALDESSVGSFNERIYFFAGKLYEPIDKLTFRKVLYDIIDKNICLPDSDMIRLQDIYSDCENTAYSKKLNLSNSVMAFSNGILDIEKGVFHKKFSKEYIQIFSVDYNYNPNMKSFLWDNFLDEVLPDKKMQDVLQMFLGATFVDRKKVKIEKILILLGVTGANGKSVIQEAVKGVLGEEYVSEQPLSKLCCPGREGELAAAGIAGKRLNYCTEMDRMDFGRQTARIKTLVSGERIVASRKFIDPYYVTSIPLLMANANQMPAVSEKDTPMLRRLYIIPFNVTIPEERQNRSLGQELKKEYPAILNWILEGRKKFIENDYNLPVDTTTPTIMMQERSEYDSALYFVRKKMNYEANPTSQTTAVQKWVHLKVLYSAYCRWCMSNNIEAFGKAKFANTLADAGFLKNRDSGGIRFGVYGGADLEDRRRKNERQLARIRGKNTESYRIYIKKKLYIIGVENFAIYAGTSQSVISRLRREGAFLYHLKAVKNRVAFEAVPCLRILLDKNIISSDDMKDAINRFAEDMRQERRKFNDWAERNGLPYRKYKDDLKQADKSLIKVDDILTRDEAIEMAREAGYDVTELVRYAKCRKENWQEKNADLEVSFSPVDYDDYND